MRRNGLDINYNCKIELNENCLKHNLLVLKLSRIKKWGGDTTYDVEVVIVYQVLLLAIVRVHHYGVY